jgi:hypothetical protein
MANKEGKIYTQAPHPWLSRAAHQDSKKLILSPNSSGLIPYPAHTLSHREMLSATHSLSLENHYRVTPRL